MNNIPATAAPIDPKPQLRFFNFSVKGLLGFVLVIAAAFGLVAWGICDMRKQGIAVKALLKVGCAVSFYNDEKGPPTMRERLRSLLGEENPRDVSYVSYMYHPNSTDNDLSDLEAFPTLRSLDLTNTQITDTGLVYVRGLTKLEDLCLNYTAVSDVALVHLHGLTELNRLSLQDTKVTDAGVQELQKALPNCWIRH